MPNMTSLKDSLGVLAGPKSPLRGFLVVVTEHTLLVEPPKDPAKPEGGIGGLTRKFVPGVQKAKVAPAGMRVTVHFAEIHRAVAGAQGSAPVDAALDALKQIKEQLATSGDGVGEKPPGPETQAATRELAKTLENSAEGLPPSITELSRDVARAVVAVVGAGAGSSFAQLYRTRVVNECDELIRGRYPFVASSARDVTLADFGLVFGFNGVFDRFFNEELQKYADVSGQNWRWRENSPVSSAAILAQFQRAERIRRNFFKPGSQSVELEFRVQPTDADDATDRFLLELDGQKFEYRNFLRDPQTARWPGPNPGQAIATWFPASGGGRARVLKAPVDGPWALFRLLDAGRFSPLGDPEDPRYVLTLEQSPQTAQIAIEAFNVRNPFGRRSDLKGFSCGS